MRQAISYALDRSAIAALMPNATPAVGINHSKLPGYDPQMRGYTYDPATAKSLLAKVGWNLDSIIKTCILKETFEDLMPMTEEVSSRGV